MEYTDKILKVAETIVAGMKSLQRPANTTRETRTKANDPVVSTTAGATNPYLLAKPAAAPAPAPVVAPAPLRMDAPIPPPSSKAPLPESNKNALRSTPNKQSTYTPPSLPTPALANPSKLINPIPLTSAPAQQRVATALEAKATAPTVKKGGRRTVNKRLNKKRRSTYRR